MDRDAISRKDLRESESELLSEDVLMLILQRCFAVSNTRATSSSEMTLSDIALMVDGAGLCDGVVSSEINASVISGGTSDSEKNV